jgi:site-specific DNA-cytosine methylase
MIALLTIIQDPLPLKTMYFIQRLQAYKQFGNSVAVPVIRELAKYIAKYINSQEITINGNKKIAS